MALRALPHGEQGFYSSPLRRNSDWPLAQTEKRAKAKVDACL